MSDSLLGQTDVLTRARDAEAKRAARPPGPPRPADDFQRHVAYNASRILEVEVDPLTVRDLGLRDSRYRTGEVTVGEVTLRGWYTSHGSYGYHHPTGSMTATVRRGRRWWFAKVRSGEVYNLADIGRLAR